MLSHDFTIQVAGIGGLWEQRYEKGRKVTELTWLRDLTHEDNWTTSVTFTLDEEIFKDHALDANAIENLLHTYAHVFPGLAVSFENHLIGDRNAFYAPSGFVGYLEQENRYKQTLHPAVGCVSRFESQEPQRSIRFNEDRNIVSFELSMAFQFLARPVPSRRSFINTHETRSHGTHLDVCLRALRDCLLGYSDIIGRRDLPGLFDHLTLAVSLWHGWPAFQGTTDARLVNRDFVQRAYEDLCLALTQYFQACPETLEALETLALTKRPRKRSRFPALRRR
jgi:DNA gyrase/topoisomerase IV subunit B